MKAQEAKQAVIDTLLKNGWTHDGATLDRIVKIPSMDFPLSCSGKAGGKPTNLGGRLRYRKGSARVTVGPRTVCFYEPCKEKSSGFRTKWMVNVNTKDIQSVDDIASKEYE